MYSVEVREMPDLLVHGIPHRGPYTGIGPSFQALGWRLEAAGLIERAWPWVGVYHDDAARVAPADLRSHACCVLPEGAEVPSGFEPIALPGGRSAVLSFRGAYCGLADPWSWLFTQWIPGHGFRPRGPSYEIYRSMFPAVPAEEQLTEIVAPLA